MQRKTNPKPQAISSVRAPAAKKPTAAAAVSSSNSNITDVAPPPELEQRAKLSPPPPFASDRWAAGGASSSSDDEEGVKKETKTKKSAVTKPAPARKSGSRSKGKDRYLVAPSQELMPASGGAPDPFAAVEDDALPSASFDPFADEAAGAGVGGEDAYVHLRVQQRNGRKTLTTVQGLSVGYKYAKVLRDLKRELCCNGTVVEDKELGSVIQLQGDHRKRVADFLAKAGLAKPDCIKLHGF